MKLYSPGDVIVLPQITEEEGHKPAGYMIVAVCSCGRNHPTEPEETTRG